MHVASVLSIGVAEDKLWANVESQQNRRNVGGVDTKCNTKP